MCRVHIRELILITNFLGLTQVELKYGKYFEVHEPTESPIFIAHTHLLRFKHTIHLPILRFRISSLYPGSA